MVVQNLLLNRALVRGFLHNTAPSYGVLVTRRRPVVRRVCYSHTLSITLLAPQWVSAVHFGGPESRLRIALSLGAVRPNTGVNLACNLHADNEFVDSITLLAPKGWSAVHFGGPTCRARLPHSLGAPPRRVRMNSACNLHADAEFVDSVTLLGPHWESAVHFGGPEIRARIELSL